MLIYVDIYIYQYIYILWDILLSRVCPPPTINVHHVTTSERYDAIAVKIHGLLGVPGRGGRGQCTHVIYYSLQLRTYT